MTGLSGACLCGQIRYSTPAVPLVVGHCHCIDCRKSSGTGHSTHILIPEEGFEMTGEPRFYDHPADSRHIVSRGFCADCGSPILSRNSAMPALLALRASSLDDPGAVTPQMIVYASRAPAWDAMDPALPCFAHMPEESAVAEMIGGAAPD
ncbi:GFA family protein [Sphingopyxis sp. MWB1]|uniref:GFA family protein n=1 Tax=Sphingopyxis sp. MWB1 TaxID=1537715 RepID=UPI00051A0281|nr:GFA family protein [Sphingopyxis sp. MWB1]